MAFVPCGHVLHQSNRFFHPNDRIRRENRVFRLSSTRRTVTSLSLRSPAPATSEASKTSFALEAWLSENGMYLSPQASWGSAKHPLVIANETTDDGEYSGRGLVASKAILQGECLFEVPVEVIITKEVSLRQFPILSEDISEYVAIAILLIAERAKGEDSFWAPYLNVLPTDEELIPLFRWTSEDRELLKGSPALAAAESLSNKLQFEFQATEEQIFSRHPEVFPQETFCFANWEWAFAILFSRAISLTSAGVIALVPYADLLNHNPFCSNYIDIHKEFLTGDKYVRLYSDRPYSLTDQVFVTYGPKSNADLLLLYGFVSDRNPYDSVELLVSLTSDDPLYEQKKEYLRESGVEETAAFPLYRDRYPMEMVEFLRFCYATDEEFQNADFGDFISESNETLVAQAIIEACQMALKSYPQTRAEDDKIMSDIGMFQMFTLKQRWAIRQRRAEKRILERTISTIEKEMVDPKFMFTESDENS